MAPSTLPPAPDRQRAEDKRAEAELLLLCARPRPEIDAGDRIRAILEGGVDWAYLLLAGHRHGLLPAMQKGLERFAGDLVPEHIAVQLAALHEANKRKSRLYQDEACRVIEALDRAGMHAVLVRPAVQGPEGSEAGERQAEPVEVQVDERDFEAARDLLLDSGYRRVHPFEGRRERLLLGSRPLPLHNHTLGLRLHLQAWSLPSPATAWSRGDVPRPGGADSAGSPAPLAREDLLLHACLHGSYHLWSRLAWIGDIDRLVQSGIDWPGLVQRAETAGALRELLLGLRLAHDLMATALPDEVSARWTDEPGVVNLAHRLRQGFYEDLRGQRTQVERLRLRLQLIRGWAERIKFCAHFAVTPDVEDFNAVALPDRMAEAYRLVRPVRLGGGLVLRRLRPRRAPYFSTPMSLVEHVLRMAGVSSDDVVYDLGCGDGRTVIAAARLYGARGVGIDLDPERIAECRRNAREAGVEDRVSFRQADALSVDLSDASVVFLWLLPSLNLLLRPRLQAELRPGSRVVGHSFDMGDWLPDRTELVLQDDDEVSIAYLWLIGGASGSQAAGAPAASG